MNFLISILLLIIGFFSGKIFSRATQNTARCAEVAIEDQEVNSKSQKTIRKTASDDGFVESNLNKNQLDSPIQGVAQQIPGQEMDSNFEDNNVPTQGAQNHPGSNTSYIQSNMFGRSEIEVNMLQKYKSITSNDYLSKTDILETALSTQLVDNTLVNDIIADEIRQFRAAHTDNQNTQSASDIVNFLAKTTVNTKPGAESTLLRAELTNLMTTVDSQSSEYREIKQIFDRLSGEE